MRWTTLAMVLASTLLVCQVSVASTASSGPLTLSNSTFDFGSAIVGFPVLRTTTVVTNNRNVALPVLSSLVGDPSYSLARGGSNTCGIVLGAGQSCNLQVNYAPQSASAPAPQTAILVVATIEGKKLTPYQVGLSGVSGAMPAGVVTATGNTMVAQYAMTLPFAGSWSVAFGQTTGYGLTTNVVASPAGGTQSLYVAGMMANTTYHMRASVTLPNGAVATDVDHTFTTGALPAGLIPPMTVTTTPGLTPQPGIELIDTILGGTKTAAYATDLAGNVIWTYAYPEQSTSLLYPIKLMPNGNMLMEIAPQSPLLAPVTDADLNTVREIDLAGNTLLDLPMPLLNSRLQAAGFTGLNLQVYSHDVTLLPNGHMLVLANMFKAFTDLPGYPGVTNVLGDVVIDLDQNLQPVWAWNTFDHLDVNRQPMGFPDWTHANAVVYSKDDGNFLISLRHQNWVIKVNYNNGAGDGSIVWKLGNEGDFALQDEAGPEDWFYAQHNPSFFSPNTDGVFSLGLMDNGDDRVHADESHCTLQGWLCYTTVPVLRLNEISKIATVTWRQTLPTNLYSSFAGDMFPLPNGNIEYDLAGVYPDTHIFEVTADATPTTVWHMYLPGTSTYRAFRIPSLYPGVQW